MAEESSGQDKSEAPTDRRLEDARKKGDIVKSQELPGAAVLLAGLLGLYFGRELLLDRFLTMTRYYLANLHSLQFNLNSTPTLLLQTALDFAFLIGPLLAMVLLTALVANYAMVGVIFSTEKIMPSFEKIDPLQGLARKFSMQTLAELIKSLAKLTIVGTIAYRTVHKIIPDLIPLMDMEAYAILAFMAKIAFWIFLKCALVIVLLAILDYLFQYWQFMKKMKMTKQEIKDEAKMTEGDPKVKGRIRALQMEMARRRMMAAVPEADVVITNPTRLAVALRYDTMAMPAPTVVAKGAGVIAQRIREIASEHNVPLVEDKPLAQLLYKNVAIDETIPENLFQPVAEVLAFVYGARKKGGR